MSSGPPLHLCAILFLLIAPLGLPFKTLAQTSFSDSSMLRHPAYVREAIQEIDDAHLWNSIDLDRAGLQDLREFVDAGDFERAAIVWGAYWSAKKQPAYITSMDHLLPDTDLLESPMELRDATLQSPDERDTIIARAELILQNTIRTWGDSVITFGKDVDFNRDMGQSGKYGFHYWIWSRPLLMSSVLTGDEKYLEKFGQLFNVWYEQRNSITRGFPSLDVVYYELGLGVRNRMFIEYYLLPCRQRSAKSQVRLLKTFLAAGRWLYQLQKWEGYRPGNWQVHGSYMLVQLALVFPEFRESAQWRQIGLQRMMEHLERDFFPDGGHSERSPRNYTMATYLNYRNLAYLLAAYDTEQETARRIRASLGRTLEWWVSMLAPTGEVPAINDSHRGLFPERITRDGRRFFTGDSGARPRYTSRHMPESGFTVMRSDWSLDALYMTVNHGPSAGFHTHLDLLDFELYAYGTPLAVDAGIGLTYDDSLYLTWYRSSRAHNMVVVNDSNMEREGLRGENIYWGSTATVDFFAGEQNGYRRFGVRHRRQIAFIKPWYWFVVDDLHSSRSIDTLSWYFHSPTVLLPAGAGFESKSAPGIRIIPVGVNCASRVGKGMAASTSVRVPGKTEEINWVRFDQVSRSDFPSQFPILLFPFRAASEIPRAARLSAQHFVVQNAGSTDNLYFASGAYADGTMQTDASFVLIRKSSDNRLSYVVVNGTYLRYRAKTLWSSDAASSGEGEVPQSSR
ncbi:MAG: hypothetical protein H6Q31_1508 [Bacteroidetes bacterium]|nr:hypothetical protein [Bacteroidota bacterium]